VVQLAIQEAAQRINHALDVFRHHEENGTHPGTDDEDDGSTVVIGPWTFTAEDLQALSKDFDNAAVWFGAAGVVADLAGSTAIGLCASGLIAPPMLGTCMNLPFAVTALALGSTLSNLSILASVASAGAAGLGYGRHTKEFHVQLGKAGINVVLKGAGAPFGFLLKKVFPKNKYLNGEATHEWVGENLERGGEVVGGWVRDLF
jgi:hypothetical protein